MGKNAAVPPPASPETMFETTLSHLFVLTTDGGKEWQDQSLMKIYDDPVEAMVLHWDGDRRIGEQRVSKRLPNVSSYNDLCH